MYDLQLTRTSREELKKLKETGQNKKLKKIADTLNKLSINPRHPGLHSHINNSYKNHLGKQTFQSYVENNTPGAYRVFWCYGLKKNELVILSIAAHPSIKG